MSRSTLATASRRFERRRSASIFQVVVSRSIRGCLACYRHDLYCTLEPMIGIISRDSLLARDIQL
jgi:hypothetical protein